MANVILLVPPTVAQLRGMYLRGEINVLEFERLVGDALPREPDELPRVVAGSMAPGGYLVPSGDA